MGGELDASITITQQGTLEFPCGRHLSILKIRDSNKESLI